MILVNTDYISGKELETLSLVKGSTIQSKHIGKDISQAFKTLVGGELTSYNEMMNEARALATKQIAYDIHRKNRRLTVATYASLSKHILAKIIKGFNKKFRDIHINILVVENIRKAYENGEADILFGEKINMDDICWEELFSDPYIAIIPKQYDFLGDCIKREELYKQTFIKAKDGKISEYIDESRFSDIINVISQDDSSVIHMVKEELGVAILPLLSVYDNRSVRCVKLDPGLHRILGLSYREHDFKIKRELRDFVEYVRSFDFEQFKNDIIC